MIPYRKLIKSKIAQAIAVTLAIPSSAFGGWIFQDVPSEIMSNAKTAQMRFTIDLPLEDAANRLSMMHALCSPGQKVNVGVDKQGGLFVTWLTAATVSHIIELKSIESKTLAVLFMNIKVETQRSVWPLLYNEWFVRGGRRCAQELIDETR